MPGTGYADAGIRGAGRTERPPAGLSRAPDLSSSGTVRPNPRGPSLSHRHPAGHIERPSTTVGGQRLNHREPEPYWIVPATARRHHGEGQLPVRGKPWGAGACFNDLEVTVE